MDGHWNVDGDRNQSVLWSGFTQFTLLREKPPDGRALSGERLTKIQATSRPDHLWPEIWSGRSEEAQRRDKQQWSIEKPKLDNARKVEARLLLSIRKMWSSKKPWKKVRNKLEAAMPCNVQKHQRRESCGKESDNRRPKVCMHRGSSWIYEKAVGKNSTQRSRGLHCRKGVQFMKSLQSCAQVYSYAPSNENPGCQRAVPRKIACMANDQRKEQKRGHQRGTERAKNSWFCYADGHLSSQECGVGIKVPEINKGHVVLRGDTVKDNSGSHAVLTVQGSCASQMTAAKGIGVIARQPECAGQAADAASAYTQVKMKDAPKLLKFPKSECSDIWTRLPRHQWPKSRSNIEDQVDPLERNLCGHPLAGSLWERQFEKFNSKMDGKMYQIGKAYSCIESKVRSCLCTWMTSNWLDHTADFESHVEEIDEIGWSGRTGIISWPCVLGMHSNTKRCSNHEALLEQLRSYLVGKNRMRKTVAWSHDMEGHAKKCVEPLCDLANKTIEQLYDVLTSRHHVLKCLYVARNGRPRNSMVREQIGTSSHKIDKSLWQSLGSFDLLHSYHE